MSRRKRSKSKASRFVQRVSADDFLLSFEWRQLRMIVIKKRGARCECCGATPKDGIRINVDHIKPRKYHPELALVESNLQVLCGDCNHGKGNWDDTDWRQETPTPPPQQTTPEFSQLLATAPRCTRCRQKAAQARWRVFSNGDVHLVWWCCEKQTGGNCLAPKWAGIFNAGDRPQSVEAPCWSKSVN